jgi:uroporphyrinogen decarboxylase
MQLQEGRMTSKQRLLAALERKLPDRLPVTTHHVMPYFTNKYMNHISSDEFFDYFGMDAIRWVIPVKPDPDTDDFFDPEQGEPGFLQVHRIFSDKWRIESERIPDDQYQTTRYTIVTPKGELTAVIQANEYTEWVASHLIKKKEDIDLVASYQTAPVCDNDAVNAAAEDFSDRGIVRGFIVPFDIYGQPGCWQDFCCLRGTEQAILDTYDDPGWVHEFLEVLVKRKLVYVRSMKGAGYDVTELGGGDASTTVISPKLFNEFVAPYDSRIIAAAHEAGIRVVYHTCGGMMPILESIAGMNPDAMETFTPPDMGGDVDLAEAKRRIGGKVCMIGGFDQGHYFSGCTPEETRRSVRKCFDEAGAGGGFILCPSDHFFDAEVELVAAFADEAKKCVY